MRATNDDLFAPLDRAFDAGLVRRHSAPGARALLFSGGVDSTLLAWEFRTRPDLRLVTIGVAGSPDLRAAESAAREIGLPHAAVEITDREIFAVEADLREELPRENMVVRSVLVALALAIRAAPAEELLCGQGADELFLGYAHFRGLGASEAAARARSDLARLLEDDWPRSERIAHRFGRRLRSPYLDPGFIAAALAVPIDRRLPGDMPKAFFRAWAEHRGLPPSLARRPKRAMQYGSGVDRLLRRRPAPATTGGPGYPPPPRRPGRATRYR